MKKALAILLTALYITVTSGIVVSTHYCMGVVKGIEVGAYSSLTCRTCGMDNKGCCHDDQQVVKLTDNHQVASVFTAPVKAFAAQPTPACDYQAILVPGQYIPVSPFHSPPISVSRNILFSVFRI